MGKLEARAGSDKCMSAVCSNTEETEEWFSRKTNTLSQISRLHSKRMKVKNSLFPEFFECHIKLIELLNVSFTEDTD